MSVIIFIIILGVLIFVHELGHFLVAKKNGIRVDEFAVGFPPKLFSFKRGGTRYALNLIPFGGYVKIFGENPDDDSLDPEASDSFVNKSKWVQAAVLVAGVTFNIIFAWVLLSISLMSGFPSVVTDTDSGRIKDAQVVVTSVVEDSPAQVQGLLPGDAILSIVSGEDVTGDNLSTAEVQEFISDHGNGELTLNIKRSGEGQVVVLSPEAGIIDDKRAIGISMDLIGKIQLPIHTAFWEGALMTGTMTKDIAVGLVTFLYQAVTGSANLDSIAGPVGIVELVGDASHFGFVYLLGFTAFISLNLAVLNLLPFPALDGGRIMFVAIEGIIRRRIKPVVANTVNFVGFSILIILMIVITISDIVKLF